MKKQSGFTAIEGLLILLIMGVVGFTGLYVWNAKNKTNSIYSSANQVATSPLSSIKKKSLTPQINPGSSNIDWTTTVNTNGSINLASGHVSLDIPANWKEILFNNASANGCKAVPVALTPLHCYDYVFLIPKTENYNNSDQFLLTVGVFSHTGSLQASQWLEDLEGLVNNPTITSMTINGQSAVKWLSDDGNVTDVTYAITSQNYVIITQANAYYGKQYYSYVNSPYVDNRIYLPQIDNILQSVKIN